MTTDVTPKILERIRKILALSENNPSVHEAASAAAMAAKLMAKYNLDRADVMVREITKDNIIIHFCDFIRRTKDLPRWMHAIIVPIAHLNDCEAQLFQMGRGEGLRVAYLGEKDDATVAAWIFEYLTAEVERLSKKFRAQQRKKFGGGGHGTNMEDYRYGLAVSIVGTIYKMQVEKSNELRGHAAGTALVVRKRDLIREKYDIKYRDPEQFELKDPYAFGHGRRDGEKVAINKPLEKQNGEA